MKPGAAILMALALITTTFAGVSYADPTTGNGSMNTIADMNYDALHLLVDFDANGTDYTALTAEIHVYDDDNFSAWFGPRDMTENDDFDNTSWDTPNQYWADISLVLFFEGSIDAPPMADEGTWYSVDAYVNDSNGYTVGQAYTQICMVNGSACDTSTDDTEAEDTFNEIDVDGDGAINGTELINHENLMRSENNDSPMNTSEETELLDAMADYDTGFTSADGNDTEDANDGMLEFNEFMEFFYNEFMSNEFTDYDLYYMDDDDNRTLEIHINDGGDYGYAFVSLANMENEVVYNSTFNTTFWTLDLHANNLYENIYFLTISIYDTMGDIIYMSGDTLGEMDYEQMVFDMYDNNSDGVISWEEYSLFLMDTDTDWDEDEEEHFDMVDKDDDGAVNSSELIYYENSLLIENDEPVMDTDEESELLAEMADYDIGWESEDGTDSEDAGDGMLEFNEFMNYENGYSSMDNVSLNLFKGMFLSQDVNDDGGLDIDEFSSFMELMMNNTDGSDDSDDSDDSGDSLFMMMMLDTDGDGNISLTEVLVMADDSGIVTFYTNVFNHNDFNGNGMLNLSELTFFMTHMDDLDPSYCYEVKAGDNVMEDGELYELGESFDEDMKKDLVAGETAPFDGEFCPEDQPLPSGEYMVFFADLNGDGKISLTEAISLLNSFSMDDGGEPLSDVEEEWVSIAFKMNDRDGDELLDDDEFENFYYQIQSLRDDDEDHDNGGDDGGETNMVCYDRENHVVVGGFTDATSCEAAGYMWTDMSQSSGGDDQNNADTEDEGDEIDFMNINVMFEQWHDDSMELVIIELAVIDNAEDIARLSMMADSMYGNNDSVLDESEVDMLMALYAMNLDVDDISKGMTLDGQNGTAVDFWVEIDGLLEGDDVVFIRVGTVIEFPTTAYDNSTAHTFVVMDEEDDQSNERMNDSMEDSMEDSENCQDYTIWIHNSDSWNVDSATGFALEETNNAWYADECALDDQESLIFTLSKVENATLPTEEEDDWTWEDEEMNMFPVCEWYYAVTLANGSMMEDQWMQDAPESGDYMITLVDNASYEIYVKCWDPEQGKMVVDITSPLGNSSNTSLGYAMGYISFKLPAGTGGNVTFDVTWTDGYYTESGTLTVYATGDGTIDLSDIEVAESEGLLPGFTAAMGVLAMLGAAMIAGRRNRA
jgi:hypothetical protein